VKRNIGKTVLKRRQTTSGHVIPPLVIVAIVISSMAVVGAVVLTLVVRCRHYHSHQHHHHSHQLAVADKQVAASPPTHMTTPFIVTSHPADRYAGYDRIAPMIPHVGYEAAK